MASCAGLTILLDVHAVIRRGSLKPHLSLSLPSIATLFETA
jgi:hypothetical protein